jgi:hypothetical protein
MDIDLEEYARRLMVSIRSEEKPVEPESRISEWLNQQCIMYYTEGYTSGYHLVPITVEIYSESKHNIQERSINL